MRRIVFIIEKFVSKKKLIKYYIENIHVLVENLKIKFKKEGLVISCSFKKQPPYKSERNLENYKLINYKRIKRKCVLCSNSTKYLTQNQIKIVAIVKLSYKFIEKEM